MIVLLGIPFLNFLPKIHKIMPNMLKRIGIGLLILVVQDALYTVLIALPMDGKNITYTGGDYSSYCYNSKLQSGVVTGNYTYLWLICPQILNGLAQLLVHMTTLEFVCAQAPRTMQGMLIGIWYAMFSIRYILMNSLDQVFTSPDELLIYQAVRSGVVMVSLVLYVCVSRTYQYRIRDWVVNVQWIVEDVFKRRIQQEESYLRQQIAEQENLPDISSSGDDELDPLLN